MPLAKDAYDEFAKSCGVADITVRWLGAIFPIKEQKSYHAMDIICTPVLGFRANPTNGFGFRGF